MIVWLALAFAAGWICSVVVRHELALYRRVQRRGGYIEIATALGPPPTSPPAKPVKPAAPTYRRIGL